MQRCDRDLDHEMKSMLGAEAADELSSSRKRRVRSPEITKLKPTERQLGCSFDLRRDRSEPLSDDDQLLQDGDRLTQAAATIKEIASRHIERMHDRGRA